MRYINISSLTFVFCKEQVRKRSIESDYNASFTKLKNRVYKIVCIAHHLKVEEKKERKKKGRKNQREQERTRV